MHLRVILNNQDLLQLLQCLSQLRWAAAPLSHLFLPWELQSFPGTVSLLLPLEGDAFPLYREEAQSK